MEEITISAKCKWKWHFRYFPSFATVLSIFNCAACRDIRRSPVKSILLPNTIREINKNNIV